MRPWLIQVVAPPLAVLLAVAGVVALGATAAAALRSRPADGAFADVQVAPPPGLDRTTFLAEVQYQADLPDRFDLNEDGLLPRLERAFARHAWVEKVERVERRASTLHVQLRYRQPVLLVPCSDGPRPLDRQGIVLPASARRPGLPSYQGETLPAPPTGGRWTEPRALACAVVIGQLPAERLPIVSATVDRRGVVLGLRAGGVVVWGNPPGQEASGEATAAQKRQRWLDHGGSGDLDLRPTSRNDAP